MSSIRPLDAVVTALVLGAVTVVVLTSRDGGGGPPRTTATPVTATRPEVLPGTLGPTPPAAVLAAPTFAVGVPGAVGATCVVVGDRPRVRSGQFVVADLQRYRRIWTTARTSDKTLFVTPLHLPPDGTGLVVRATLLGGGPHPTRRVVGDPADYVSAPGYFTLDTTLPGPGRWRLEMSSGADRGCFLLDLPLTRPAATG